MTCNCTDEFYNSVLPPTLTPEERNVAVQALAGLLWSKQFYHIVIEDWYVHVTMCVCYCGVCGHVSVFVRICTFVHFV